MTIVELKDQIVKNSLSNFYIFTGTEIGIINIYLEQMSKVLGLPIRRANSVAEIYPLCEGGSLFGDSLGFYVIREDHDFMKAENYYPNIKSAIRKNVVVLLYEKIDTRLKFGKFFKDDTVAFEKLTPAVLSTYIRREISLSENMVNKLMELCDNSYDMCMLEIDKIKQYAFSGNYPIMPDSAFTQLLESGVIYQPPELDIFKFCDAVMSKNVKQAFKMCNQLISNGTSSVSILGVLYNSVKNVMLIQSCYPGDNISDVTGLDSRQIYFNKKYAGKYSTEHLVSSLKLLNKTISGIKSGWIDDEYATHYALTQIM